MPRFTASRRAAVATAVGLALPLSLVVFSQVSQMVAAPTAGVACSLQQFHGNLVAENGRPVFRSIQHNLAPDPLPLDWPDGSTIRPTDDGQLEVVDVTGLVRARTGTRIVMLQVGTTFEEAFNRDGEFMVCPWPGVYNGPDSDAP